MMVVLGKNKIGKLVPRNSGKELCRWTPQTGQTVKIFVPYLNIHQWVSTAEQALNQVDKIMWSVAISQLLSQDPVFSFWAHEQSGHGGRDGGNTQGKPHGLLLTQADLATSTAEYPT